MKIVPSFFSLWWKAVQHRLKYRGAVELDDATERVGEFRDFQQALGSEMVLHNFPPLKDCLNGLEVMQAFSASRSRHASKAFMVADTQGIVIMWFNGAVQFQLIEAGHVIYQSDL